MNWHASTLAGSDNVATLLRPVAAGERVVVRTPDGLVEVIAIDAIALCHKIALADLAPGGRVIKYGQCIGEASTAVRRGEWVHIHNIRSRRAQVPAGNWP